MLILWPILSASQERRVGQEIRLPSVCDSCGSAIMADSVSQVIQPAGKESGGQFVM